MDKDIIKHIGNCLDILPTLPEKSVDCCVTSPPYWGLRDYGVEGQLGLEETPDKFVDNLVKVFREVRRVLKDNGTLWLNLGDTYSNHRDSKSTSQTLAKGGSSEKAHVIEKGKNHSRNSKMLKSVGLKHKDLVGIPWRVALALQQDGWYLRSDIIWSKPNPMPESVTDRPTKAHEYIFLLSKSEKYYYDNEAIKEPIAESTIGRGPVDFGGAKGRGYKPEEGDPNFRNGSEQWGRTFNYKSSCKNGRNKRTVWTVPTKPYKEAHFATFPPKLIEPCILAGCPEGGTVLDPFGGSGTTAMVAIQHRRKAILIELNPEYEKLQDKRTTEIQIEAF